MIFPSMRGGLYRCLRILRGSFGVHVGLGTRPFSRGGAQPAAHDLRRSTRGAALSGRGARWDSFLRTFRDRLASGPVELLWTWYFGFMTQMFCRRIGLKPRLDLRNDARLE